MSLINKVCLSWGSGLTHTHTPLRGWKDNAHPILHPPPTLHTHLHTDTISGLWGVRQLTIWNPSALFPFAVNYWPIKLCTEKPKHGENKTLLGFFHGPGSARFSHTKLWWHASPLWLRQRLEIPHTWSNYVCYRQLRWNSVGMTSFKCEHQQSKVLKISVSALKKRHQCTECIVYWCQYIHES